jgi:predicted RND superfamily exporter protein
MLRSAPRSMKNGYFTSELQFYDLQDHLMTESLTSVLITAGIASLILYIVTGNIIVTMLAVICVYTSVTCSLAILALLRWHLNVLESLVITMASGLSIDFILHYAIKYNAHLERELRIKYLIYKNLGPICIATLTTLLTGVILLSSDILAFNQIGIFMIILITNSFIFSNFGFLSLLYRFGPSFKTDFEFCKRIFAVNELQDETNITSQVNESNLHFFVVL